MSVKEIKVKDFTYICGCVKNCGKYLNKVFENIKKISVLFEDYKIIIAYDKSEDDSLDILKFYSNQENKENKDKMEIIIGEDIPSNIRTKNIAKARNSILEYIRNDYKKNKKNYIIMIDCDDVCSKNIDIDILKKTLERRNEDWDCVSFNLDYYYDIWALSIKPYVFSCWHWGKNNIDESIPFVKTIHKFITNKLKTTEQTELVECLSAFNGFAIYKLEKFINCTYEWDINKIIKLLESCSKSLLKKNQNVFNKKISYITKKIEDCEKDYSVIKKIEDCEHRHFHIEAIKKNNAKIRISPLKLFIS
jgi:hypothetical protein